MEIPAVELSQLNLPAFLSISKVSVLEHENKKKKNIKDKKKKEPKVSISVIRFYYRQNSVEKVMCKEIKFRSEIRYSANNEHRRFQHFR